MGNLTRDTLSKILQIYGGRSRKGLCRRRNISSQNNIYEWSFSLRRLAKKTMFKIAFHGGFSNMWSGVMSIPEVRE
jgi:hypothetical protein